MPFPGKRKWPWIAKRLHNGLFLHVDGPHAVDYAAGKSGNVHTVFLTAPGYDTVTHEPRESRLAAAFATVWERGEVTLRNARGLAKGISDKDARDAILAALIEKGFVK